MSRHEIVIDAARQHGADHFGGAELTAVEIAGPAIGLGGGLESWLVRVESGRRSIVVSIVVDAEGVAEATHHTRLAA